MIRYSDKNLIEKIRHKIEVFKIIFNLLSVFLFTAYTLIMLLRRWGNSIYLFIILGFVIFYIILFTAFIVITKMRGKKIDNSIKNYKSGLKIIKALLTLINLGLSVSIFSFTLISNFESFFETVVLIISIVWASFQIVWQIIKFIKRYRKNKRRKRKRKQLAQSRQKF